jgi:hypothetical protein
VRERNDTAFAMGMANERGFDLVEVVMPQSSFIFHHLARPQSGVCRRFFIFIFLCCS